MAVLFIDSSALVKRYVSETGTAWVLGITDPAVGNSLYIARITGVETISAITRRLRRGEITVAAAAAAITDFRLDFAAQYLSVEVTEGLVAHAMDLAETYGLRGYDAVQLAAGLHVHTTGLSLGLPALTFIAADGDLLAAAAAEGMMTDNPNSHP